MTTKLEEMVNPSTKSVFYVVGETPQLKIGLRVAMDNWMSLPVGGAALMFRIRVVPKEENTLPLETLAEFELGALSWTTKMPKHLSKAGAIRLQFTPGLGVAGFLQFVKDIGAYESLYVELNKQYPNVKWLIGAEDFVNMFYQQLVESKPVSPPAAETIPYLLLWEGDKAPSAGQGASTAFAH